MHGTWGNEGDTEPKTQPLTIWSRGVDRQASSYSSHGARSCGFEPRGGRAWRNMPTMPGSCGHPGRPLNKEKWLTSIRLISLYYKKMIIPTPFVDINVKLWNRMAMPWASPRICISLPFSCPQTPRPSSTFFFSLLSNKVLFVNPWQHTSLDPQNSLLHPFSFSFLPPRSKHPDSRLLFLATASSLRVRGAGVQGKGDIAVLDTSPLSIFLNPGPLKPSQIGLGVPGSHSIPLSSSPASVYWKEKRE